MDILWIFFNMKVCCVFPSESPHRGDSYEYTQNTILNVKRKSIKICSYGVFLQGTQERV